MESVTSKQTEAWHRLRGWLQRPGWNFYKIVVENEDKWSWLGCGWTASYWIWYAVYLAAMVNEVKSFAYTVNSQLFIHAWTKLLILYGLWRPFLCFPPPHLPPCPICCPSSPKAWFPLLPDFLRGVPSCSPHFYFCFLIGPQLLCPLLCSPPGFLSDSSFLSYLKLVIEKLVKENSVEDDVCCSLLLWNERMKRSRESVLVIQSWLTPCNPIH